MMDTMAMYVGYATMLLFTLALLAFGYWTVLSIIRDHIYQTYADKHLFDAIAEWNKNHPEKAWPHSDYKDDILDIEDIRKVDIEDDFFIKNRKND